MYMGYNFEIQVATNCKIPCIYTQIWSEYPLPWVCIIQWLLIIILHTSSTNYFMNYNNHQISIFVQYYCFVKLSILHPHSYI